MAPIYLITGAPAVGKSTLAEALIRRFPNGLHIPVDDLRLWVKSGLADSVPWTVETERQFQIAEEAACRVARTYAAHGFAVVIDHCRNLERLDQVVSRHLEGCQVARICLVTDLQTNLERNRARRNKDFDPEVLAETIAFLSPRFREDRREGWFVLDNTNAEAESCVDAILNRFGRADCA